MILPFESLDQYFFDFAVDCILPDLSTIKVIFDCPDQEVLASLVITSEFKITCKTSDVSKVLELDQLKIDSVSYIVRKKIKIEDGNLSELYLSRSS